MWEVWIPLENNERYKYLQFSGVNEGVIIKEFPQNHYKRRTTKMSLWRNLFRLPSVADISSTAMKRSRSVVQAWKHG